jgi:lipopolysaccharide/colanic/teichoic acid biosynthesis glycosyltransferase
VGHGRSGCQSSRIFNHDITLFNLHNQGFISLFQAIQSPGPLFHRETRSGQGKRPFRIFNFRTLRTTHSGAFKQATATDQQVYPNWPFLKRNLS